MHPTQAGIGTIGESGMFLPDLIIRGLAASDRLNYYLTLLQSAYSHADDSSDATPDLRVQREASGVDNPALDRLIDASVERGVDAVYIPGASPIVESMFDEARRMLRPLLVAGKAQSELHGRAEVYESRLNDLVAHAPVCGDDVVTKYTIGILTRLTPNGHDTLYQLALDLQWELNRLHDTLTMETIDGARVFGIQEDERPLVRAFMKGINETVSLKCDSAGLATTVTREGGRLAIQNDLAGRPSHFVVLHITGLSVTVTYGDPHKARTRFLQEMLGDFDVHWTLLPATESGEVITGQYTARAPEQLDRFLTVCGSRLVFLIGWNRARKRLSQLVSKADAFDLLKWAADHRIGHAAFLKSGDVQMIESALERAFSVDLQPGAKLDNWLGEEGARTFLRSVLRTTSLGLGAGRPLRLIEDEIQADLLQYLRASDRRILADTADHALLISALNDQVQTLMRLKNGSGHGETPRTAELAASCTVEADQIMRHAARWLEVAESDHHLRGVLTEADAAVGALEEALFLLTLVPPTLDPKMLSLLDGMAHLVADAVRDYVGCLEESRRLSASSVRSDVESFLLTIDHLVGRGRQARTEKRTLLDKLLRTPGDVNQLFVVGKLADQFGTAATALARCGPIVRDRVMRTRLSR